MSKTTRTLPAHLIGCGDHIMVNGEELIVSDTCNSWYGTRFDEDGHAIPVIHLERIEEAPTGRYTVSVRHIPYGTLPARKMTPVTLAPSFPDWEYELRTR